MAPRDRVATEETTEHQKFRTNKLTAVFVADGAVGDGTTLGDGHGDGVLDASLARGAGRHDGAQALGAAPDAPYLRAAAGRHLGLGFCVAAAHGASLSVILSAGTRHCPAPRAEASRACRGTSAEERCSTGRI